MINFDEMIKIIEKIVCNGENIQVADIHTESREVEFKEPRQIIMYLTRSNTGMTHKSIGKYYENKDHATVVNAVMRIQNLIDSGRTFKSKIAGYQEKISNYKEEMAKVSPDLLMVAILKADIADLELKILEKKGILSEMLNKLNG